ncbi:D-alanyl-D-alanine carboxypeptidase family protein [Candidatus Peregrinibacteria bacterium]|nr:D-alanyl-D-alanine carboxypeptidase family protein [Candidatus Peregrinibacteria bacterium]
MNNTIESVKRPEAIPLSEADKLAMSLVQPAKDMVSGEVAKELISRDISSVKPEKFFRLGWEGRLALVAGFKPGTKPVVGDRFILDFKENIALSYQTRVEDMLPYGVRAVKWDGDVYERRGNQGFFCGGEYLTMWNKLDITVMAIEDEYSAAAEYKEKFGKSFGGVERSIGEDFVVDGYILAAFLKKAGEGKAGFKGNVREFVEVAAMILQNIEASYGFGDTVQGGHYNPVFLGFALNGLKKYFPGLDKTLWIDVVKEYASAVNFEFKAEDMEKPDVFSSVENFNENNLPDDPVRTDIIGGRPVTAQPVVLMALRLADRDFYIATGEHLVVISDYRSVEEQREIREEFGYTDDSQPSGTGGHSLAAPPGKSFHEKGLAVDIQNWEMAEPYLQAYGLVGGIENDRGHFSMGEMNPGIFRQVALARRERKMKEREA